MGTPTGTPAAATTTATAASSQAVKPYRPKFGLWWLAWMVLGLLFFFTVAYGIGF
jgi:hypothetical protein